MDLLKKGVLSGFLGKNSFDKATAFIFWVRLLFYFRNTVRSVGSSQFIKLIA
jgi:hypothetical protein